MLEAAGLGRDEIAWVADRNTHKQGRLMPGSHVPDRQPGQDPRGHAGRAPHAAVEFSSDEILDQQNRVRRARGGQLHPASPDSRRWPNRTPWHRAPTSHKAGLNAPDLRTNCQARHGDAPARVLHASRRSRCTACLLLDDTGQRRATTPSGDHRRWSICPRAAGSSRIAAFDRVGTRSIRREYEEPRRRFSNPDSTDFSQTKLCSRLGRQSLRPRLDKTRTRDRLRQRRVSWSELCETERTAAGSESIPAYRPETDQETTPKRANRLPGRVLHRRKHRRTRSADLIAVPPHARAHPADVRGVRRDGPERSDRRTATTSS